MVLALRLTFVLRCYIVVQADLWSIGTILFELLVGKPPYNGSNHIQLLRNIEASEARLPEHIAGRLSPACKALLGRLLQRNPVGRITFEEFFTHPFLSGDGAQGQCAWLVLLSLKLDS
jgi:serine/threonine-protein kinase ULK/ATG1